MSIFNKLKNVLFEDVTEEIPVFTEEKKGIIKEKAEPVIQEVVKQEEIPRFRETKEEKIDKSILSNNDKDLKFKDDGESSVFQQFDEEEFDRIAAINKSRLIERDRKLREEKEKEDYLKNHNRMISEREQKLAHNDNFSAVGTVKKEVEQPKRFVPSPVISPVYGILDKNYKKEDILPRASSDGTLPKVIDVDSVRKKAFGTLEEDIENINDEIIGDDTLIKTSEIKITSYDDEEEVTNNDYLVNDGDESVELANNDIETRDINDKTIEELEKENEEQEEIEAKKEREEVIDNSEVEDDLLNLIDSMYKED